MCGFQAIGGQTQIFVYQPGDPAPRRGCMTSLLL